MLLPPDTRHWDQWQLAHRRSTGHSFNETGETSRHKPTISVERMDVVSISKQHDNKCRKSTRSKWADLKSCRVTETTIT